MALTKISTDGFKDQSIDLTKLPHGDSNNDGKFLRANNGADPSFETVSGGGSSSQLTDTNGTVKVEVDTSAIKVFDSFRIQDGNLPAVSFRNSDGSTAYGLVKFSSVGAYFTNQTQDTDTSFQTKNASGTFTKILFRNILGTNSSNANRHDVLIGRDMSTTSGALNLPTDLNARFPGIGGVELYHIDSNGAGTKKFETTGGGATFFGHVLPSGGYNLGSTSYPWSNVYTNDLHLSNEGHSNDVDGTWGNWTIQEGESDLFLKNNRSGKKYKFNLTEIS